MKNPTFVNLTPHTINLNDGTIFTSQGVARVSATFTDVDDMFCDQAFGHITGLPDPVANTFFIVSGLVLQAAKDQGRTDCCAPATGHPDTVRNAKGHIVSVPKFVR